MNIDCSTEQLERQLCPPDWPSQNLDFEWSGLDDPSPSNGSLFYGSSSPAASIGSDGYEDSFNRDVNDLNCSNDPSLTTGMNINFDHMSWQLSPESMADSPVNENDINVDNMETRSRSDSLLLVPESSQDVAHNLKSNFYFPTQDIEKIPSQEYDSVGGFDDNAQLIAESLNDDDLDVDKVMDALNELSSQDSSVDYVPDYPNLVVQPRQPIQDNFLQADASQLERGIDVFELPSQRAVESPDSATISADPSFISSSPEVSSCESDETAEPKRRGRKRRADDLSPSQRKRQQNADAAKRYRKKKDLEQKKIMEEREKVEKELEATRRRVQKKMDERNIMLKLIYDSYQDPKSNLKDKYKHIIFPKWLPKWLKTESEESDS